MNNILYQKSLQLFQSENNDEQKKLYDEILELTNKALKSADQNFLSEALDEAEKNEKSGIFSHINGMINLSVNQMNHSDYSSYLFVLPLILQSPTPNVTVTSIESIEKFLRIALQSENVISKFSNVDPLSVNFAPVLLGKKSVFSMNMSEWHKIHRATDSTLTQRDSRAMYKNSFSIQIEPTTVQLFFLTFVVKMPLNSEPTFYNPTKINHDSMFKIINSLESFLESNVPNSSWIALPFGTVNETIANAFDFYQLLLADQLITKQATDINTHFGLIPTNNDLSFSLIAWNKPKNLVLDALIINPFAKDLSSVVNDVLDLLNKHHVEALYIGDHNIPLKDFDNLGKFDFAYYLRKYGASVLKPE